jgi:hypothetical protein
MFVVGYTPGGASYGVFEDEMDADLDTGYCDPGVLTQPHAERGRRGRDAAAWQTSWVGEHIDPLMSQITSPEQVTLA